MTTRRDVIALWRRAGGAAAHFAPAAARNRDDNTRKHFAPKARRAVKPARTLLAARRFANTIDLTGREAEASRRRLSCRRHRRLRPFWPPIHSFVTSGP